MVSELPTPQTSRDRRFGMRWLGRSLRATSRVLRQPKIGRRRADDKPIDGALATATTSEFRQEETALQQVVDIIVTATATFQRDLRAAAQQDLTATGSKTWGSWWDGRGLLRIKIYDFAIYVDAETLQSAKLSNTLRKASRRKHAPAKVTPDLFQRVVADHNVEMSLTVRPSRDLPLGIMAGEYKRILRKRMQGVGGNPDDAALHTLLQYFDAENLPASATRRGCIKKDTVLNFCRTKSGTLTAVANGAHLTCVQSHKLCEAVFDLYLGEAPVSRRARTAAGQSMLEMMTQPATLRV